MAMPAGLAMAERADDRDGLKLDQLQVALGPVLADWPAALVVRTALQGDVIQQVEVATLTSTTVSDGFPFWDEPWLRAAAGEAVTRGEAARRRAASHLDSLGRLLAVAGWEEAALTARRLRDLLLAGAPSARLLPPAARLAQRLERSRTLRWLTGSLGILEAEAATAAGVTGPALRANGDVTARWRRWLVECNEALGQVDDRAPLAAAEREGPRGRLDGPTLPSRPLLAVVPQLLAGAELAAARLIVASLDPDLDELVRAPHAAVAGG